VATIVLSGTRGPWLFLVIREGLGSPIAGNNRALPPDGIPVWNVSGWWIDLSLLAVASQSVDEGVCGDRLWLGFSCDEVPG
jgi:hypothetical protein